MWEKRKTSVQKESTLDDKDPNRRRNLWEIIFHLFWIDDQGIGESGLLNKNKKIKSNLIVFQIQDTQMSRIYDHFFFIGFETMFYFWKIDK